MRSIDKWIWNERGSWLPRMAAAGSIACALSFSAIASADDAAPWSTRYEAARQHLVAGQSRLAEQEFLDLAEVASSDADRHLAIEMARVAGGLGKSGDDAAAAAAVEPKLARFARPPRTRDEITLLYATSFMYGAGTGAWFLLQAQPDSAFTATLPFIGITAAPVIALALIDGHAPLPRGVPHGIAVGMYLGLGESLLAVSYQHARAHRLDASGGARWSPEQSSSVLWGGATLGGIAGAAITAGIPTTPGRVSYTGSLSLWSGLLTGFTVSALLPQTDYRAEHSILAADIGYNVGLLGGMMTAATVSPSVTRVRLVDLSGLAGGFIVGGSYLALANGGDSRVAMTVTALGTATGLGVGWFATRGMQRDTAGTGSSSQITVQPSIAPVAGGGMLGVAGAM